MAFCFLLHRLAAACLVVAAGSAQAATTADLMRMTDQLDKMDKLDFEQAIDRADKCIQARDFSCSEAQLKTARKFALGNAAKDSLRRAESRELAEKEAVEAERQAIARRQRELEEEERRLQAAEERAAQQAAREAEENSGMSTGQKIALFGSLLGQAYQNQAATRLAEAANARRFQQQLDVSKAEVARNQQRFAEERARLEAQRGRQQPQQVQQAPQQQQQRQLVASADTRQALQAQQVQQAQMQREQEAAAQRAQAAQRAETEARTRAAAQAEQQNRAAQTLAAAVNNARTPSGNAGSGSSGNVPGSSTGGAGRTSSAGQDSRIKLHGTMYVVHYAALKHSRSDRNNITLVERVTPVQWTYDVPRVSPLQQPSGPSNAVPYQVSDLLLKQMRSKFFDYLRDKYSICSGGSTPEGCYGWSVYSQVGNSAAEVQGKLNASLGSFSAPVTNDSGLDYPDSIAYSE